MQAWTQERFSYTGKYYQLRDVGVTPKPFQKPHPPIYMAATTAETFPVAGRTGRHLFVGVRRSSVEGVKQSVAIYRQAWREAGHPGQGDVTLRLPVYVGSTRAQAIAEAETSTVQYYRRLGENLRRSVGRSGTAASEDRARMAEELANVAYETLLRDWVVYGTPAEVTERLQQLIDELDLSGVILEMNAGGLIPAERVLNSLRLFGEQVVPQFR